jgi:hypothetical protein
MHDSNTSTRPLLGSSIVITVHAETIGVVRTVDLSNGDDQLVSLQVGHDRSGVRLLGDIAVVRHLVAQAGVELARPRRRRAMTGKRDSMTLPELRTRVEAIAATYPEATLMLPKWRTLSATAMRLPADLDAHPAIVGGRGGAR